MTLSFLFEMTTVWLVCYLFYYLWLRNERMPRANRLFLLLSLLAGFVIPFLPSLTIFPTTGLAGQFLVELDEITVMAYQNAPAFPAEKTSSNWLVGLWLGGAIIVLLRLFSGWWQLYKVLKKSPSIVDHVTYKLVDIPSGGSPFSYGKYLFWPEDLNAEDEKWRAVLDHEIAHINQGHTYDLLLIDLLSIPLWWNPMLYCYRRSLRLQHEYLADEAATKNQRTNVRDYAQLLLQHQLVGWVPSPGHAFYHSHLKNRIIMLTQPKGASWKLLAILPLLMVLVWACNEGAADITGTNMAETEEAMARVRAEAEGLGTFEMVNGEKVYKVVDQMPIYGDCSAELSTGDIEEATNCGNTKLLTDVYTNIKYPAVAREAGAEGLAVITFVVPATGGEAKDIKLLRSTAAGEFMKSKKDKEGNNDVTVTGYGGEDVPLQTETEKAAHDALDAAALETVRNLPQSWLAGQQDGKPVAVRFNLPIKFKLTE